MFSWAVCFTFKNAYPEVIMRRSSFLGVRWQCLARLGRGSPEQLDRAAGCDVLSTVRAYSSLERLATHECDSSGGQAPAVQLSKRSRPELVVLSNGIDAGLIYWIQRLISNGISCAYESQTRST